jgi:hypothetical protein
MGKWIEHVMHRHWEVYGGVKAGVLSCINIKMFEGVGKTDLKQGGYKIGKEDLCKALPSFESISRNFVRGTLKVFKNLQFVNMQCCKLSSVSPKGNRVSDSVWQTLMKSNYPMEENNNVDDNETLLFFVAPLMSFKHYVLRCVEALI